MAVCPAQRLSGDIRRYQESLRTLKEREFSGIMKFDLLRKEGL